MISESDFRFDATFLRKFKGYTKTNKKGQVTQKVGDAETLVKQFIRKLNDLENRFPSGLDFRNTRVLGYAKVKSLAQGQDYYLMNEFISIVDTKGRQSVTIENNEYRPLVLETIAQQADGDIYKLMQAIKFFVNESFSNLRNTERSWREMYVYSNPTGSNPDDMPIYYKDIRSIKDVRGYI